MGLGVKKIKKNCYNCKFEHNCIIQQDSRDACKYHQFKCLKLLMGVKKMVYVTGSRKDLMNRLNALLGTNYSWNRLNKLDLQRLVTELEKWPKC